MRLFVAAELDGAVREEIGRALAGLSSRHKGFRPVRPENLHVTLKFIGEVDEAGVGEVESAIARSVQGMRPFNIHIRGMGWFGPRKSAKVVWVGVGEGRDGLASLANMLEATLSGFRKEPKAFSPHITVCRPRGGTQELIADVEMLGEKDFGWTEVREVKLMKSTLAPGGSLYEDVSSFRLA